MSDEKRKARERYCPGCAKIVNVKGSGRDCKHCGSETKLPDCEGDDALSADEIFRKYSRINKA